MKPKFSFKYDEKEYRLDCSGTHELGNGISVTAEMKEYPEYDAVYWLLHFENGSDKNSGIFSDILDCDTVIPLDMPTDKRNGYMPKLSDGDTCVISMDGTIENGAYFSGKNKSCAVEYGVNENYFKNTKRITFENAYYRSSEGVMPFFDITASGDGAITAVGWTGGWRAVFTKEAEGVKIATGLKDARFYLKPGEKLRTTSTLIMKYSKDEDKYNKFRKLIKNHFSHKACTNADRDGILACELWGGLPSEEMVKRIDELKSHGVQFEDLWIDAAWYGSGTNCISSFEGDWSETTGDWFVNKKYHPNGLRDVAACAKDGGMGMMIWVEPERARKTSAFFKLHPEWLLDKEKPDGNTILYYGNEDAFNYVYETLSGLIENLGMSCYRQDFNTNLGPFFKYNDEENRIGITEIKHISGMYRLWDALLERFPGLIIDNCASGGTRIDIETLKRSIAFFRSDYQCNFNEDPDVLQVHNAGISKYLPYTGCTSKTKADTYAARSSFSSSWGGAFYNAVFQSMDEADFEWAKKIVDEYRRIRKYFHCNFYNHGSEVYDKTSWAIWQYHDDETDSGIVMAFRRCDSPFDCVKIDLRGLSGGEYTFTGLDSGDSFVTFGELEISLPEKRSCTVFEYSKK